MWLSLLGIEENAKKTHAIYETLWNYTFKVMALTT